uniref:Uncharacterized protein n=1 Tax=Octopus bimaculoides TaxID=37653 RepID=A0A0L8GXH1_OCTBM
MLQQFLNGCTKNNIINLYAHTHTHHHHYFTGFLCLRERFNSWLKIPMWSNNKRKTHETLTITIKTDLLTDKRLPLSLAGHSDFIIQLHPTSCFNTDSVTP